MDDSIFRVEKDTMGDVKVPKDSYWGAQTQRAVDNFPISGIKFSRPFIRALGIVKMFAAETNMELDKLDEKLGGAIIKASEEVIEGKLDNQFVVDIFQTGSGTSTNMNANEVIANRANEILGEEKGKKYPVHPNDHVNMGQSSNDVIPTCMNIAADQLLEGELIPSLKDLESSLKKKVKEFWGIIKIGRTHLQDATPIRLGQEFSGYKEMITKGIERINNVRTHLRELALGGTAVGTGINTHPDFALETISKINNYLKSKYVKANNHFEAQGARDSIVELSSALKNVAISLMKIAEDIRLLASGPRCGIGEISLPEVQPGSSIMPGKVNPVIPEAVIQVSAQVIGNDTTISICGVRGILELNLMMPLMTYNVIQSITILANVTKVFTEKCISGIKVNNDRIKELIEQSLALVTAIVPVIGYDRAAEIAKEAFESRKTIKQVIEERGLLSENEIKSLLNPENMV